MAEASDSEGSSIKGWALVDKQGDLEHSDSASTSSGSDFVNLDSDVVSYHHKEKQNDPEEAAESTEHQVSQENEVCDKLVAPVARVESGVPCTIVDSPVDSLGSDIEVLGPEASPDLETVNPDEDTVQFQDTILTDSSSSIEELHTIHRDDEPIGLEECTSGVVEANSPIDEDIENHDESEEEVDGSESGEEPDINYAEDSDHSDFVKLDTSMAEEAVAGPSSGMRPVPEVMQASTSSTASSISPSFQFVHALPIQGERFQPHRNYEDDDDSIPSDVDDRCESDISGVAADDTDLSAMSYSIGDVPLVCGPKSYRHWPNSTLNATLTVLALLALFTAIGIGVGHYFGSVRDVNLRQQQIHKMKTIQDDYLMCLKQQTNLEKRLKQPSVSDNKLAAVAAIWKDKYEELIVEKADLEEKLVELKFQVTSQLDTAAKQIKDAQEAAGKLSQDISSLDPAFVEVHRAEYERLLQEHKQLAEALKAKELEFVRLNVTMSTALRAKQRYLDTLRRHMTGIAADHLKTAAKKDALASELTRSVVTNEKVQEDYELVKQEVNLLEEQLKTLQDKYKSNEEELIKQWETEVKNKEVLTRELKDIKIKLNQLEGENSEIRWSISRLRYAKHPGNEVENSQVKVHELKDKVNQLANENVDLKSVVVKIRYASPTDEQADVGSPEYRQNGIEEIPREDLEPSDANSTDEVSSEELKNLEHKLKDAQQQLQRERSNSLLLQAMYMAEKERANREEEFAPSLFTCLSFLFPSVNLSTVFNFQPNLTNASHQVQQNLAFLSNLTADANYTAQIGEKWKNLVDYASQTLKLKEKSLDYNEVYDEAKGVIGDMQNSIKERWADFQRFIKSSKFVNKSTEKIVKAANNIHEKAKNFTDQSRINDYVNKTKESVSRLSQKIEDTWHKVKNLSGDFMKSKTVKSVADKVESGFKKLKENVQSSFQKVSRHFHWRGKPKHRHKHRNHKHSQGKKASFSGQVDERNGQWESQFSGGSVPYDNMFVNEEKREFENKPSHRQKQSSNHVDKEYHEFWKKAHFDPDDIIHDDFFEGNKREWRKHQKTLRKIHNRVQKLNEDIFLDMDEDDIEDMYDDLEDFEDDIEDKKEQPQGLKTWLSCQLRWWKGRIQRKKQDEKLITECGRQIMHWQLRATCSPSCASKKCKNHSKYLAKVCKTVMDTQVHKETVSASTSRSGKSHSASPSQPDRQYHSVKVTGDKAMEGRVSTPYGQLKYSVQLDPLDSKDDDMPAEAVNETIPYLEKGDQASWYFQRVQDREDSHTDGPKWLFQRMEYREDQRHDPQWQFQRAEEREFEREKSWYLKRADYRQSRFQNLAHSDDEMGHKSP